MPRDPAEQSLSELRRRYLDGGRPVSRRLLARLRHDPRQGARDLGAVLERRQRRERAEAARLDALLHFERLLWRSGLTRVAGVDEAGVGPLAGPVVAAAVVFPPGTELAGVDDSKRLDAPAREALALHIHDCAAGVGIGLAEVEEIDRVNVYNAALAAMRRAVEALPEPPEHLLVDAREVPGVTMPQNRFDKGDGLDFSIAAASIVAKTHRDGLMQDLDRRHPAYGFARHKGYGTAEHQEALRRHGPCPVHRSSFAVLRELCGEYSTRFYRLRAELDQVDGAEALAAFERRLAAVAGELADEELRKLRLVAGRRWRAL